ncbi:sensor histidine kinase [Glaciihabitans sp. dw_435]|uniref:sensor histidine kinase n=1 Tax=Glaciihabitans sp. dw_435 TaxID=2720081 RepID=UPI001BD614E0|nr:ATP-binding protein [Glaciihabitans sp. dw_435]
MAYQFVYLDRPLWPALIALAPMGFFLAVLNQRSTRLNAILYLAVSGVAVAVYTVVLVEQMPAAVLNGLFLLNLPLVALVMTSGPARTVAESIVWPVAGFVTGALSAQISTAVIGMHTGVDMGSLAALVVIVIIRVVAGSARRKAARGQAGLHRAARDEQFAVVRSRVESRAAALLHDTVLGHLSLVAGGTAGAIDPFVRRTLEKDLVVLIGQEWLAEPEEEDPIFGSPSKCEVVQVIQAVREQGLTVETSGAFDDLIRVVADRRQSLALATEQLLINVLKHSGTTRADVIVSSTPTAVSVMVLDSGKGFDPKSTRADRLGLRQSVTGRMTQSGGTAQIWSTPGNGTAVLLTVPAGPQESA